MPTYQPLIDTPLLPIAVAAQTAGLSERAFVKGITDAQIPVPIIRVGVRRYVRKSDLMAWIHPPSANADLFSTYPGNPNGRKTQ